MLSEITRQESGIKQFQRARSEVRTMFTQAGITPIAIVPRNVFNTICKKCHLLQFEQTQTTNVGLYFENMLPTIGNILSFTPQELERHIKTERENRISKKPNGNWYASVTIPFLEINTAKGLKIICWECPLELWIHTFYDYDTVNEHQYPNKEGAKWRPEAMTASFLGQLRLNQYGAILGNTWTITDETYNKARIGGDMLRFIPVPEKESDTLLAFHEQFPQFHVFTAADAGALQLVFEDGRTMDDYFQTHLEFATEVSKALFGFVDKYGIYPAIPWGSRERDSAVQIMRSMCQDMEEKLWSISRYKLSGEIDESRLAFKADPIMYTPVEHSVEKTTFDLVVVISQFGEPENEKKAIEELKQLDASYFLGTKAN